MASSISFIVIPACSASSQRASKLAVLADDLDQLRADELSGAEHPDHAPFGQYLLDPRHAELPSRASIHQNQDGIRSSGQRKRAAPAQRPRRQATVEPTPILGHNQEGCVPAVGSSPWKGSRLS